MPGSFRAKGPDARRIPPGRRGNLCGATSIAAFPSFSGETNAVPLWIFADWLLAGGDTCGAKASIGEFRKPAFDTQKGGLETILANARHVKADPLARPMAKLPNGSPACGSTACSRDRCCES